MAQVQRVQCAWREHEEAVLYALAVLVYVPLGVIFRSIVLNWIVGILFPLLVVSVLPALVRRARAGRRTRGAGA